MAKLNVAFQLLFVESMIFLGAVAQNSGFENQCNSATVFYAARNRALRMLAYTTKTLRSRVLCGRECSMEERCRSFNFYEDTETCEMSGTSRSQHFEEFSETQSSVYFDADENTPMLSLADNFFDMYTTQGSMYLDAEEHTTENLYRNKTCKTLLDDSYRSSGVYTIYPNGPNGMLVYCDMETDGGGWIVFQRRQDGSVDFDRVWGEYKAGFGDLSGEFWLGNDNLANLTFSHATRPWELRIDLEDWEGNSAWAKYGHFVISTEPVQYQAMAFQYNFSSTAGDSFMAGFSTAPFTTKDRDHDTWFDGNCAQLYKGAWWFPQCQNSESVLNGLYNRNQVANESQGIFWLHWKGANYSLKGCSMKIRELRARV